MNLSNLSRDDILAALGLQTRGPETWIAPLLIGIGCGALVGASVALLIAPRPGDQLRSELMERGRNLVRRGRETVDQALEQGNGHGAPEAR